MDLISSGQVTHAGTYNSNPIVIAAGLATVQHLKTHRQAIYSHLNSVGERLRKGLQTCLKVAGIPALVGGKGPVVQVSLTNQSVIRNYRDWARRDTGTYQRIVTGLAERGIRSIPRGTWYLSTEHSERDVDQTLSKFGDALQVLKSPLRT